MHKYSIELDDEDDKEEDAQKPMKSGGVFGMPYPGSANAAAAAAAAAAFNFTFAAQPTPNPAAYYMRW
uniref:Uncharacterized protein n=1 Tax=Caenorhabditis japonica TaxID=281687 RepID=A0A8R1EG98_CAEJA